MCQYFQASVSQVVDVGNIFINMPIENNVIIIRITQNINIFKFKCFTP